MKCTICGKGNVIETEEKDHKAKICGQEITISVAIVGRCDTCNEINYAFDKANIEEVRSIIDAQD